MKNSDDESEVDLRERYYLPKRRKCLGEVDLRCLVAERY